MTQDRLEQIKNKPHGEVVGELIAEVSRLKQREERIADALQASPCTCRWISEDHCPQCGSVLGEVRWDPDSMLNRDQFDAVRAGDYYCARCKGTEAKTGYKYWWKSQLKRQKLICGRCAALSDIPTSAPAPDAVDKGGGANCETQTGHKSETVSPISNAAPGASEAKK